MTCNTCKTCNLLGPHPEHPDHYYVCEAVPALPVNCTGFVIYDTRAVRIVPRRRVDETPHLLRPCPCWEPKPEKAG